MIYGETPWPLLVKITVQVSSCHKILLKMKKICAGIYISAQWQDRLNNLFEIMLYSKNTFKKKIPKEKETGLEHPLENRKKPLFCYFMHFFFFYPFTQPPACEMNSYDCSWTNPCVFKVWNISLNNWCFWFLEMLWQLRLPPLQQPQLKPGPGAWSHHRGCSSGDTVTLVSCF